MTEVVFKYIVVPFVTVIGVYIVGSTIYHLFGVPAVALFCAVGGIAFFARFFSR